MNIGLKYSPVSLHKRYKISTLRMLSIGWCMCHLLRRNNLFCTRYEPELSLPSTEDWILQRRMLIPSTQRAIIAPPPCMGSGREMALLGNHTNPIKLLLLTINYLKHYKLFHQELRYPFSIRVSPRDSLGILSDSDYDLSMYLHLRYMYVSCFLSSTF